MSNIITKIHRRNAKRAGTYEGAPQPLEDLPCGGYRTLHPTRGWQYVSGKRLAAQQKMAQQFGFVR